MNIEEKIEEIELNLKKIIQFDPDPYYVNYFFKSYLLLINKIYQEIFEEANRDFGLFVSGKCTKIKFEEKAHQKNDTKALEFVSRYNKKYDEEHKAPYPYFIKKCCEFLIKYKKLPDIKIMIRAKERYSDDIIQKISINLHDGKLSSKEELQIEIKRQLPLFLEVINIKRNKKNEPKVNENQVVASTFLNIGENIDTEIVYASEVYIPVMRRFLDDMRNKIKELTEWK